jgi:RNA polymerase sigma factor (TIGR02999 family)
VSDVTRILHRVQEGDPQAAEQLLPLVYDELRKLAAHKMAAEAPGQTLQATALVHEAWLRLTGSEQPRWNDSRHFLRAAAEAMRRILVDRARERRARKRGGDPQQTELSDSKLPAAELTDPDILAVDAALEEFARHDPVSADLVKLRYFVGLNMSEAAEALGIPLRTAERLWTFARAWLRKEIAGDLAR